MPQYTSESEQHQDLQLGDRALDKYQKSVPGETPKELVIVGLYPQTTAAEYTLPQREVNGSTDTDTSDVTESTQVSRTLAEATDNWPPDAWNVGVADDYNPDSDWVVEVVFHESLDQAFTGAWVEWDIDTMYDICERNNVPIYAYHRARITTV